jgi:phosphatidylglycerol---prolipoprotein diacylglyceryl transferase
VTIPFNPAIGGIPINIHMILEYAAFFLAYQYYVKLRKRREDVISSSNRLSIILGAAIGALAGSRIVGILENPLLTLTSVDLVDLYNAKTIMGGLFGGLLGVEIAKYIIGENHSSGDLFTLPIIIGIFVGRIGCFLSGTNEFTYGRVTSSMLGMDLGDGLRRHPIALYELLFLGILYFILKLWYEKKSYEPGLLFKIFMLTYFGFRFLIEFLKPNVFFLLGLSTIQWLCILCFVYYRKTLTYLLKCLLESTPITTSR